jgi:ADP-dependent NAD(P)H-hydrate dehydratase / NAD(P)H-hydrate epimerase
MRPLLSVDEMKEWETRLIEAGVPSLILMENAGRGAAHILGLRDRPRGDSPRMATSTHGSCVRCADESSLKEVRYLIVCGPGKNGGDGFAVARHLLSRGAQVTVLATKAIDELSGDAASMAQALVALGVKIGLARAEAVHEFRGSAIVDALLGTGVKGAVSSEMALVIEAMNASPIVKVALDVPSGLDADFGAIHDGPRGRVAVRASHTITFGHLKRGLLTTLGADYAGRITLAHIGVPANLGPIAPPSAWLLETSDIARALVPRSLVAHKSIVGEVAIVGGAPGMVGAAHLAARAALRAGAGIATIHSERASARELDGEVLEVMTRAYDRTHGGPIRLEFGRARALVLGPGLGRSEVAGDLYHGTLLAAQEQELPVVIDADGLRLSLGRLSMLRTLAESGVALVMTPHAGEAAHLLEVTSAEVEADRFGAAGRLAQRTGAVVVLKGPRTIVAAPRESPRVSPFGSVALATAGSGDVLSGIVGSLIAQARASGSTRGVDDFDLVSAAVALHGMAGELFEHEQGSAGCLASDLIGLLPRVRAELFDQAGT